MIESLILIFFLMKEHGKVGECPYLVPQELVLVKEINAF